MGPLPLGRVVATPATLNVLTEASEDPLRYLARHASGDLDIHDRRENERSLRHGWRILSSYPVGEKVIWISTEADRSVTTLLLSEEY